MPDRLQKIIITDEEHRLPYSKGLMSMSIMATGLPPDQAYNIASDVHEALRDEGNSTVSIEHVQEITEEILARETGKKYVENYRKWRKLTKLGKPIIILLGGATGVGKSTVATMLAARFGITRVVSTDAIREVMRSSFAPELIPALYNSSFSASEALRIPLPKTTDKVILGFLEQSAMVLVGIRAIIDRAVVERTNLIVEGAHVVPGILDSQYFRDAFVVQMVLSVSDEAEHMSHFEIREVQTEGNRPFKKYIDNIDNIRRIQDYVLELATEQKVPVFPCHNIDSTVGAIIKYVLEQVFVDYTEGRGTRGMVEKAFETSL
ncbi:MAG: zeta toxin family protein [Actinobacteria bacterium]|nr:zeta toxin family protein [Actinomycetota bacterium]